MYLIVLISAIIIIPQANTLKCNQCFTPDETCEGGERQCSGEFTRCGTMREVAYKGSQEPDSHALSGSCFKAGDCKNGSFNFGAVRYIFTSKCCDTDLCNIAQPLPPSIHSNPNGRKCYSCDGKSDCTETRNCDGEETFCVSMTEQNTTFKGCATRSLCVDPPSILASRLQQLKCCEGDHCNGGNSTMACLLLLTIVLISLFFLLH